MNWISQEKNYWIIFWIEYSWKKWYWIIPWIEFYREMNEWIIFWIDICHFWWKVPFFVYFGHFLDNFRALFLFDQYQRVPDYWIELSFELNQQNFFFNWIIFWIESWVKRYWIEYWMNHILAKFKHWIESDRVSNTPSWHLPGLFLLLHRTMDENNLRGIWNASTLKNISFFCHLSTGEKPVNEDGQLDV